ncbi:hypothetical protein INS49_007561 [Diaporthe citri]|uniref:uncharacterized protein n=1 Tax=Diaporthe citri TaxID=83186 RepID=UPI001C7F477B|nr:uncharacterized protein INS49_007561 [Diaporthe citri]KAG6353262.1 hypothetical protein INS49_007561 [Diaporthe citri]
MKLSTSALLFFVPAVFGYWNCELPKGSGDLGRCVPSGADAGQMFNPCGEGHPCVTAGNGCTPVGGGVAKCS